MLCYYTLHPFNPRLLAWKNHMCSENQGPVGVDGCGLAKKNTSLEYKKYSPITMLLRR